MKNIFEIHAPGIDTSQVIASVEKRLEERGYDPDETKRIEELSFAPVSPAAEHGFDPAVTTELFERPVSAPDFKSLKYRRFPAPFRKGARWLFQFLSSVNEKLSQNRVQAFYNVVHEIISVNHRLKRLQRRFEALAADNLELRRRLNDSRPAGPGQLPPSPVESRLNREMAIALREHLGDASGPVLLLGDDAGHAAAELKLCGISLVEQATSRSPDEDLWQRADGSLAAILLTDAGRFCGQAELLPELCQRKLRQGGLLFFRMNTGADGSVFVPALRYNVDAASLKSACEHLGLRFLSERIPEGLRESSFESWFAKN